MNNLYEDNKDMFDITRLDDGTLLVSVRVKGFSGEFIYCIEDENLEDYICAFEEFHLAESGVCKFSDMDSDSYILFQKSKHGHMQISGQLGCTFHNNYLVFEMPADQTVITNLIHRLK